jgi:hypothetical protein
MTEREDVKWVILWNIGILVGLIGLPAMLGFFAGARIEAATRTSLFPWRLVFVALGVLVGGLAAWRTLMPRGATRRRE